MSLRLELVSLASREGANVRGLCRRFAVHPSTAYKWIARHRAGGGDPAALADRSRRPAGSPRRVAGEVEAAVAAVRAEHPCWGGRKIRHALLRAGRGDAPAASTVTAILRRRGLLDGGESAKHAPFTRFQRERPNDLWQLDFKGHFALADAAGTRCHPLGVVDDHSRFCVLLKACADERAATVRAHLTGAFRAYGLPLWILCDNGSPWGTAGAPDPFGPWTELTAWLLLLGVSVTHGRPRHPQTQGKQERFNRTVKAEAVGTRAFADLPAAQGRFDHYRDVYNLRRPHEALGMGVPADRYGPSPRPFPEALPSPQYGPGDQVRRVQQGGVVSYRGREFKVGRAFVGHPVAIRPTGADGELGVFFCHQRVAKIDMTGHSNPS